MKGHTPRAWAAASALALLPVLGTAGPGWSQSVPYSDPEARGTITLCNQALQRQDGGSVADRPFLWRAVSSVPAPAPYDGEGRLAFLFAYQPRQGVGPGEWSGEQLTGPTSYTNAGAPMAQFTEIDYALEVFLERFPARWDGLLQLRMYFGAPGNPPSQEYVAADIQVSGGSWRLLRGGDGACDAGQATSAETLLPDFAQRKVEAAAEVAARTPAAPPAAPPAGPPPAALPSQATGGPSASPGPAPGGEASVPTTTAPSRSPSAGGVAGGGQGGGSVPPWVLLVGGLASAAALGAWVLRRRAA